MEKKGPMVTAQDDDGVPVRRNSSFFKSDPAAAEVNSTIEIRKDPADVTRAPDTTDVPMQSDATLSRRYPQHMRTRPGWTTMFEADGELHTNSFKKSLLEFCSGPLVGLETF